MSNIFVLEGKKQAKDRHTQADHGSECRLGHETVPAMSLVEVSQPLSPSPHQEKGSRTRPASLRED